MQVRLGDYTLISWVWCTLVSQHDMHTELISKVNHKYIIITYSNYIYVSMYYVVKCIYGIFSKIMQI